MILQCYPRNLEILWYPLAQSFDRIAKESGDKPSKMSELKKSTTFSRRNKKTLTLSAPPPKSSAPSAGDAQIPGGLGNDVARTDTLEIGVEFKLDLRSEDLIVLKELGAGNGGTVSKVMHAATKVIMAKKVWT